MRVRFREDGAGGNGSALPVYEEQGNHRWCCIGGGGSGGCGFGDAVATVRSGAYFAEGASRGNAGGAGGTRVADAAGVVARFLPRRLSSRSSGGGGSVGGGGVVGEEEEGEEEDVFAANIPARVARPGRGGGGGGTGTRSAGRADPRTARGDGGGDGGGANRMPRFFALAAPPPPPPPPPPPSPPPVGLLRTWGCSARRAASLALWPPSIDCVSRPRGHAVGARDEWSRLS